MNPEKIIERTNHCVCKMCGGKLEARIIIYNKYGGQGVEMYCPSCNRIEYGTEAEIYRLAKDFVESVEFDYYTELEEGKRNYQLNIAKICEVLGWCFRKLEIINDNGLIKDKVCNFDYENHN